jgi:L-lysine exporter family protein LysE/ArgO
LIVSYFDLFVSGFLLSLSLCLDIGIVNVALINTALSSGMRSAMQLGLGSCVGDVFYALLSLLGIGLLLQFDWLRWALTWGGLAMLLYLAWDAARAVLHERVGGAAEIPASESVASIEPRQLFARGVVLSLASPSSIVWFAAVGGSVIAQHNPHSQVGMLVLLSGFFAGGFSWCLFITGLSVHGGRVLGARFRLLCNALSAVLFAYFALRIVLGLLHGL